MVGMGLNYAVTEALRDLTRAWRGRALESLREGGQRSNGLAGVVVEAGATSDDLPWGGHRAVKGFCPSFGQVSPQHQPGSLIGLAARHTKAGGLLELTYFAVLTHRLSPLPEACNCHKVETGLAKA